MKASASERVKVGGVVSVWRACSNSVSTSVEEGGGAYCGGCSSRWRVGGGGRCWRGTQKRVCCGEKEEEVLEDEAIVDGVADGVEIRGIHNHVGESLPAGPEVGKLGDGG